MEDKSPLFRDVSFGLLYFVQGVALAYFSNFQKPYLNSYGVDADIIGLLTSLLLLPFILKIFVGMLSDRVNLFGLGHRKPYIIAGLLLASAGFAFAGFVDPETQFIVYAVSVFIGSFSVTLFDTATDGLAIDTTPRDMQSHIQSIMTGGRAAGFILLSFLFGQIAGSAGFRAVFIVMAVLILVPLIWVVQMREPAERDLSEAFDWSAFKVMGQPRILWFAAFALVQSFIQFGIDGLPTFYMASEFGASEVMIGTYGTVRGIGALCGAVLTAVLVMRIGRRRALLLSIGMTALFGGAFAFANSANTVILMGVIWGATWAFQGTLFVILAMDLCDARIAASMFAIMMGVINLGTALGEGIGTSLTDNIGFSGVFLLFAGLTVLEVVLAWQLFRIAPEIVNPVATIEPTPQSA